MLASPRFGGETSESLGGGTTVPPAPMSGPSGTGLKRFAESDTNGELHTPKLERGTGGRSGIIPSSSRSVEALRWNPPAPMSVVVVVPVSEVPTESS